MIFEVWEDEEGTTLSTANNIVDLKNKGLLSKNAKLLYKIEASDYEEAMIKHHNKMGWEKYKPMKK
ncbi:hypothetical protein B0H98_1332 [Vreelandella songnenensis]|uniref:Uncharacterized protein n=1 Tax=Vreelandella songnenensis TaxID=1176243 RepID=A0A2T0UEF7_9GAMM|nr:hypothetical protein [Halomonas songnenensis]PRY56282.1 hypothetical protein B0H98_1332 [Halomonas songnenensis]